MRITVGLFLRPIVEGASLANTICPRCLGCLSYFKDKSVSPSVRRSAGLPPNTLKASIVVFFFFSQILLTSGFRLVQNSFGEGGEKKEATGYFSCHKVTSHTEEMNNIRKTDPGYQKSSVS